MTVANSEQARVESSDPREEKESDGPDRKIIIHGSASVIAPRPSSIERKKAGVLSDPVTLSGKAKQDWFRHPRETPFRESHTSN